MEGLINDDDDESRYEQRKRWNVYTNYDDTYKTNHDDNEREELCEVHEPLDKFEGVDFRRWQKKMHFLLSTMSMVYVLTTPMPEDGENATVEHTKKMEQMGDDIK
ncbi:hypothetical protein Tco_1517925 [Tanacetum coccineum]